MQCITLLTGTCTLDLSCEVLKTIISTDGIYIYSMLIIWLVYVH